ncbi:MAG: fumarate/nitrate reduction transcriptional regulator Fnr [Burkholderiaceae bacterium]
MSATKPIVVPVESSPAPGTLHARLKAVCANCNLRELCVPGGVPVEDLDRLDPLVATRRRVKRGEALFRAGDEFKSLFALRTGFFKTRVTSEDGRDQVTGFQMPGELLGLDGIAGEAHSVDAVALQDSEVCTIPYEDLERILHGFSPLQHHFHRVLSREIVRDHGVMLLLGSMRAEERLAAFLLNLSQRFKARGYSSTEFVLRMTREEIGSFLGLKLETVSRCFSRFHDEGVLAVSNKQVQILDIDALQRLVGGECGPD